MNLQFDIKGIPEIKKILEDITPKNAQKLIKNTNYGLAAELRNEVRANAPVDEGDLKKSVSVKNLRSHPDKPTAIVYFKPLGFYWRFIENGTTEQAAHPFVRPAVNRIRANIQQIMVNRFVKALERLTKQALKRQAKK